MGHVPVSVDRIAKDYQLIGRHVDPMRLMYRKLNVAAFFHMKRQWEAATVLAQISALSKQ